MEDSWLRLPWRPLGEAVDLNADPFMNGCGAAGAIFMRIVIQNANWRLGAYMPHACPVLSPEGGCARWSVCFYSY